jgi:TRAP-type C4-dicarboxylate transport system permease small subunit
MFTAIEKFLSAVAGGILLSVMMLLVTVDVAGRFFFNFPIQGTTEIIEFLMVALLYVTLAHTQALKGHINVDIFLSYFAPRTRLVFNLIAYSLGGILFALIGWQGVLAAMKAWKFWETTFGVIAFPLFPSKALIPFGSFLLVLRYLLDIWETLKKLTAKGANRGIA